MKYNTDIMHLEQYKRLLEKFMDLIEAEPERRDELGNQFREAMNIIVKGYEAKISLPL